MVEPVFVGWSSYVSKKIKEIVKASTHYKVHKKIKFGVVVSDTYEEALALDKDNGDGL